MSYRVTGTVKSAISTGSPPYTSVTLQIPVLGYSTTPPTFHHTLIHCFLSFNVGNKEALGTDPFQDHPCRNIAFSWYIKAVNAGITIDSGTFPDANDQTNRSFLEKNITEYNNYVDDTIEIKITRTSPPYDPNNCHASDYPLKAEADVNNYFTP